MREDDDRSLDPIIEKHGRLSPGKLLEHVGEARLRNRCVFLESVYNEICDRWPGVYLNPYLLRETVESYFCDVYRLKFFRPVDFANEHKKAAYTIKWISRIRPIQMIGGHGPDTAALMGNAYFALMAAFALLKIRFDAGNDDWWRSYVTDTVYFLHYHSVSADSLSGEMRVLHALRKTRNRNEETQ